jgi:hypothetical protein
VGHRSAPRPRAGGGRLNAGEAGGRAKPLVETLAVELDPDTAGRFSVQAIDRPAAGESNAETYSLDVRGRVVARDTTVESVELWSRGEPLASIPFPVPAVRGEEGGGEGRFYVTVGSLALPAGWELSVVAQLAGGEQAPIGTIRGRRAGLRARFEPRYQPLMLTSPGRSGTTVFMRLLEGHPDIAAYPPFEHEPRVATYWIEVLLALSDARSWMRQIAPAGALLPDWWLGRRPPATRRLSRPAIQNWLGSEGVEVLGEFCMSRIDAVYEQIAALEGGGVERYFAEKFRPDAVPELMWELYPRAKEVILVRDLRDMVASIFASSAKRGAQDLPADRVTYVTQDVKRRASAAAEAWRTRSSRAHLVRYEDLMLSPDETLHDVLKYLEIDSSPAAVEAMRAHAERPVDAMERHRTTPDPAASIGRWRDDLSADVREACHQTMFKELRLFGYEAP